MIEDVLLIVAEVLLVALTGTVWKRKCPIRLTKSLLIAF